MKPPVEIKKQEISTNFNPRPQQLEVHMNLKRFNVLVCHRRFGKTVLAVNELVSDALQNTLPNPRYAYIAPLYSQAKRVAWDYIKYHTQNIPGRKVSESELMISFNGATPGSVAKIYLLGADNPDSLVGVYHDGVVIDEFGLIRQSLWSTVIRPTLIDRNGWVIFIGTPRGKNMFSELYFNNMDDPDWFCKMYKASETGLVPKKELDAAKRDMSENDYEQEFECSFDAAIQGAYYAKYLHEAFEDGRICKVRIDKNIPVHTAWDLGVDDATSIWFFQLYPMGEIAIVNYFEDSGQGLDYYVRVLDEMGHVYGKHLAPHDIKVRELSTGRSRLELARKLGLRFTVVPKLPVKDGIDAVRSILPKCWFDKDGCQAGIDALEMYRQAWNKRMNLPSDRPLHDWSSHAADSFRTLAMGLKRVESSLVDGGGYGQYFEEHAPPAMN